MFDEETEELAHELDLDVAFPAASLRHRLDSKIVTTELANEAGVPSVPNTMGQAATYSELLSLAVASGLGTDLVVQTPYGDSGQTTHFVARHASLPVPPARVHGSRLRHRRRGVERPLGQGAARGQWSQFVLKDVDEETELITVAPATGIWRMRRDGTVEFVRCDTDWHDVRDEDEAFYLRIAFAGGYRYPGADLGILVTRGRLQTDEHELTDRAKLWIAGMKAQFRSTPIDTGADAVKPEPFGFKML